MSRLLLASNRLPVTVKLERGRVSVKPSPGGLATGLWGPHQKGDGLWFGWPGDMSKLTAVQRADVERKLAELRTVPLQLSEQEYHRYYEGFSNSVFWPLCHYQIDKVSIDSKDFDAYHQVNERVADLLASAYEPGDVVWVHDYHLMLVPHMLRDQIPDAKIGFFLHIPWPSSEVFRILPWREVVLRGLLGADLIGFHTHSYMRHFASSVLRLLGVEARMDSVDFEGRRVRLGAFPMGIDAREFAALADNPDVLQAAAQIRHDPHPRKLFVAVDRLDYTKGIPRRLLAFERLLETSPELQDQVRLVQVAVPSRDAIGSYQTLRRRVEELLGRINSRFATPTSVPIHSMYRSLRRDEVVALYRAADVMTVTPLRDGLNLVAKEFCASRTDEDGVLILSEFAGAAAELGEALRVNPYDLDKMAAAFKQALQMAPDERKRRMRAMRERIFERDVHDWCRSFLHALEQVGSTEQTPRPLLLRGPALDRLVGQLREADPIWLFLDYDGTLVPFAPFPEMAGPDADLYELLEALGRHPRIRVYLMSGRMRADLEKWFAHLPIGLSAEHGYWIRSPAGEWTAITELDTEWREQVIQIMGAFAERTPGSFVETKTTSIAWHYRNCDVDFGLFQAHELRAHLTETLANLPLQVLPGDKVVEVRFQGVNKGVAVHRILGEHFEGRAVALGDDRTDEDMFAAVLPKGCAIQVGYKVTQARHRLPTYTDARAFLRRLL
ncbi:MAG TPA: bifunctional alpha,alpha-trehalose-phosphate synthase (UDP-forming)/trehalose-phosphatase [Phycisphaerae bacterium]|nr:bifunctional alpha,alpha-trehalose-phosphate synthase (UDP-forming)/trehalose-phosphatase [Phycisphaerae bacterium]HOM50810.1 bifunctional alpha,alpha-trehalose-phosphate synthase (UDP-forming)/trehalose-phosphatase [Phycisphaerae bacterium]HPP26015.1 bifunctional alpha,alpha-trehalose-phosphate synthase (UDP-forming)/trehalose-phosphatase [Phycisphaerae bacterium]HPU26996.1 bifunctional alpha,alpha-trehalose-phosphate synthase (UDP-forming)/trehalose-phosphatase [Phycisphaerae bacterium]HQE